MHSSTLDVLFLFCWQMTYTWHMRSPRNLDNTLNHFKNDLLQLDLWRTIEGWNSWPTKAAHLRTNATFIQESLKLNTDSSFPLTQSGTRVCIIPAISPSQNPPCLKLKKLGDHLCWCTELLEFWKVSCSYIKRMFDPLQITVPSFFNTWHRDRLQVKDFQRTFAE